MLKNEGGSGLLRYRQAYLREHDPPVLAVRGKRDRIFGPAGAEAFQRDAKRLELRLIDGGHFALEEDTPAIAGAIREFGSKFGVL